MINASEFIDFNAFNCKQYHCNESSRDNSKNKTTPITFITSTLIGNDWALAFLRDGLTGIETEPCREAKDPVSLEIAE